MMFFLPYTKGRQAQSVQKVWLCTWKGKKKKNGSFNLFFFFFFSRKKKEKEINPPEKKKQVENDSMAYPTLFSFVKLNMAAT